MAKLDPERARGKQRPSHIPGKGAALNIDEIRKTGLLLQNQLGAILFDSTEKDALLHDLDRTLAWAEVLIARYDRNGPPVNETLLQRMEATLRLAQEFPDQFQPTFVKDLKANIAALQKKVQ